MAIRVNRYLSESGYCSRREADAYIAEGIVEVNGVVALFNTKVDVKDIVTIDGERVIPSRVVNFTAMAAPKSRPKEFVAPKVDKLPKWLIELRKKHGNYVEEERPKVERQGNSAKSAKPKRRGGAKRHTPKKNFNN